MLQCLNDSMTQSLRGGRMGIEIRGMAPLLQVFDMPTSIAFYRDVLGFEVVTTSNPGAERFDWALLRLNGIELMGEVDGFPGVPAVGGSGWGCARCRAG